MKKQEDDQLVELSRKRRELEQQDEDLENEYKYFQSFKEDYLDYRRHNEDDSEQIRNSNYSDKLLDAEEIIQKNTQHIFKIIDEALDDLQADRKKIQQQQDQLQKEYQKLVKEGK